MIMCRFSEILNPGSSICETTILLNEHLPCEAAAEATLQLLVWCFSSLYVHASSSLEECFFTDAGITFKTQSTRRVPK